MEKKEFVLMKDRTDEELLLSIILPIYNVEEYLFECMESVNASISGINAEVLLIDDGSPDKSGEIAREYTKDHKAFRYFYKQNGGISDTRNFGVRHARGKYIGFVDSDDIVTQDMYRNMIASAEYYDADMTIVNVVRFTAAAANQSLLHKGIFDSISSNVTHISKDPVLIYDTTVWNKIVKRSFWEEHGFLFPVGRIYEDMPVSLQMHYLAKRISIVRKVGYMWRVRESGTKSYTQETGSLRKLKDRIAMLEDMFAYIENEIPDNGNILREFRKKALDVDIKLLLNDLGDASDKFAEEYFDDINSFLSRHFSPEDYKTVRIIEQQKYRYAQSRDLQQLRKLLKYEKSRYSKARYIESDGRITMDLDPGLFTIEERDPSVDFITTYPSCNITDIAIKENELIADGYVYIPRLNVAEAKEQEVKAFLVNDLTGRAVSLETIPLMNHKLTERKGFLYDSKKDIASNYNYDWTGFRFTVSIDEMLTQGFDYGTHLLRIHYKNILAENDMYLRTADTMFRERANGLAVFRSGIYAEVSFDVSGSLLLEIKDCGKDISKANHYFASLDEEGLFYHTDKDLTIKRERREVLSMAEFEQMDTADSDSTEKKLSITVNTTGLHQNKPSVTETRLLCTEKGISDKESGQKDAIVIAACNAVESNALSEQNQIITSRFCIEFTQESFTKDLKKGRYVILLEAVFSDGSSALTSVMLSYGETYKTETFDQNIFIYAGNDSEATMDVNLIWADEDSESDKRKYMVKHEYSKWIKEPVDPELVLLEAGQGETENGVISAYYEHIRTDHPEYRCLLALHDPHTAFPGTAKRVRIGSRDYYRGLAEASIIISDTKLPKKYHKRQEQITSVFESSTEQKSDVQIKKDFSEILAAKRKIKIKTAEKKIKTIIKKLLKK